MVCDKGKGIILESALKGYSARPLEIRDGCNPIIQFCELHDGKHRHVMEWLQQIPKVIKPVDIEALGWSEDQLAAEDKEVMETSPLCHQIDVDGPIVIIGKENNAQPTEDDPSHTLNMPQSTEAAAPVMGENRAQASSTGAVDFTKDNGDMMKNEDGNNVPDNVKLDKNEDAPEEKEEQPSKPKKKSQDKAKKGSKKEAKPKEGDNGGKNSSGGSSPEETSSITLSGSVSDSEDSESSEESSESGLLSSSDDNAGSNPLPPAKHHHHKSSGHKRPGDKDKAKKQKAKPKPKS